MRRRRGLCRDPSVRIGPEVAVRAEGSSIWQAACQRTLNVRCQLVLGIETKRYLAADESAVVFDVDLVESIQRRPDLIPLQAKATRVIQDLRLFEDPVISLGVS